MTSWYFITWTVQYLFGFVLSLVISIYIFRKYSKSRAYQSFLLFGLSISLWAIFTFLHRNAPTAILSKDFFRFALFFSSINQSLILLTALYIEKSKPYFLLVTIPAFIAGTILLVLAPYDIVWGDYGWSYLSYPLGKLVSPVLGSFYLIATVAVLCVKIKRSLISVLKKKYLILLCSYIGLYGVGMAITNIVIGSDPNFPPIGGILLTAAFLVIAYGIALPAEKIELRYSEKS